MGTLSNRTFYGLLGVVTIGALIGIALWRPNSSSELPSKPDDSSTASMQPVPSGSPGQTSPARERIRVGGVWRAATDVSAIRPAPTVKSPLPSAGRSPNVAVDANPHARSIHEAIQKKTAPERLTTFKRGKPFDVQTYQAAPEEYLNTIEPGRVFQPAQPGPQVTRLQRVSPRYVRLVQGDTVSLRVQAEPGFPVSFYSNRLGSFENGLTAITVAAGDDGIAEVQYTASAGTRGDVNVLAASPANSGQVRYTIHVSIPAEPPMLGMK